MIAFRWRKRLINTDFDDLRFSGISFTVDEGILIVTHDASLYRDDWSGSLEYRFRTPEADRIVELVCSLNV